MTCLEFIEYKWKCVSLHYICETVKADKEHWHLTLKETKKMGDCHRV